MSEHAIALIGACIIASERRGLDTKRLKALLGRLKGE